MKLTIAQRLELLRYSLAFKIFLAFLTVALIFLMATVLGWYPKLINSGGRGPGWVCHVIPDGEDICEKTPPFPKPKQLPPSP